MNQTLACPDCGRSLNVPDTLAGHLVKCPACHHSFTAPEIAAAAPPPSRQASPPAPRPAGPGEDVPRGLNLSLDDDAPPTAAAVPRAVPSPEPEPEPEAGPAPARRPRLNDEHDDLRDCPNCGKQLHRDYLRCPYCGKRLSSPPAGRRRYLGRRSAVPHRGGLVLALGIIGLVGVFCAPVGLLFGIFAWVYGRNDLKRMSRGEMDPEGEGLTYAGWVCGIIATLLSLLLLVSCGSVWTIGYINEINEQNRFHRRRF